MLMHRARWIAAVLMLAPAALSADQTSPDLTVNAISFDGATTSLTVWPTETSVGGFVRIGGVSISNPGTANAGAFTLGLYFSADQNVTTGDTRVASTAFASLAAGASQPWSSREIVIPQTLPPGDYYIGVLVDDANSVAESNENNNQSITAGTIHVAGPVDVDLLPGPLNLVVGDGTYSASTNALAAPQATVKLFGWSVINRGAQDAGSIAVGFYLSSDNVITRDDRLIRSRVVPGVAAGAFYSTLRYDVTFRLPSDLTPGQYFFGMIVDRDQQIAENTLGRETNNASAVPLQILPGPPDTTRIWRLQIRLTTADVRDAHTDDSVSVSLNGDHIAWLDYSRDDFERGSAFTYDIPVKGVRTLGDIESLRIDKESTNGWCMARAQIYVNETRVFDHNFAPHCRWIDPPGPNAALVFSYADLRRSGLWQQYTWNFPSAFRESEIESMVEAIVGDALHYKTADWGPSSESGVDASYLSPNGVRLAVTFEAEVPLAPNPMITVTMNAHITCSCGDVSVGVSDVGATASEPWYPGWLKDLIADAVADSLQSLVDQLGLSIDMGVPICPIIKVLAPNAHIQFEIPALSQDLSIMTTLNAQRVRPGAQVVVNQSVANLGNVNSGPFTTDIYLATSLSPIADVQALIQNGIPLTSSQTGAGPAACGPAATRSDQVTLPATLQCSAPFEEFAVPLRSDRMTLRPSTERRYWVITAISGSGEPVGSNNFAVSALTISLPDVVVPDLAGRVDLTTNRLTVRRLRIMNRGGFASERLRVSAVLSNLARDRVYRLAQGELPSIPAGGSVIWPGFSANLGLTIPPGPYILQLRIDQANGAPECNLQNNEQSTRIEVL